MTYWNNLNLTESSILLILEVEFLTSKSCNTSWKKSMYEHVTYFFVVPTYSDFFGLFLTFSLWKRLIYMLLCGVSSSRHPKITKLCLYIYIYTHKHTHTQTHIHTYIHIYTTAAKRVRKYQKFLMVKLYNTVKS